MKKLIFAAVLGSTHIVHASEIQEQIVCKVPNLGGVKALIIESGTEFTPPGSAAYSPGTLTLVGANGSNEKLRPIAGIGGTFNNLKFPNKFMYTNDAIKPTVLKFETKQLGTILVTYVCHRPNAYYCEDRSGNLTDAARVVVNISGNRILNFNGQALPLCKRNVLR